MVRYLSLALVTLMAFGTAIVHAAEDDPAAYILEVDGSAPPGLEEFAAIDAGAAFVLPGATTVSFNHLAACQTVRVKGGILIINEKDFSLPGGEVLSTEKSECPEKIALATEGVVGGVRLRSFKQTRNIQPSVIRWALPIRPVIFLRGKKAGSIGRIKVMKGEDVVIEVPVSRDPVVWPGSASALDYDTPYLLKLEDAASAKVSETWVRTMSKDAERKSAVVFLYID